MRILKLSKYPILVAMVGFLAFASTGHADFSNSQPVVIVAASQGGTSQTLAVLGDQIKGYIAWSNTVGFRVQCTDLNGNVDDIYWPVPTNSVTLPANVASLRIAHSDSVFVKALF